MGLKDLKQKFSFLKWFDPFTYVDIYIMPKVNPNEHEIKAWVVYIFFAFIFAFLIYNGFGLLLGTQSPMVIVVSNSMVPELHRGDVVIIQGITNETVFAPEIKLLDYSILDGVPINYYASTFCTENTSPELISCDSFKAQIFSHKRSKINSFQIKKIKFINGEEVEILKTGDIVVYDSDLQGKPIIHRAVAKIKTANDYYVLTKGDSEFNPLLDQESGIASSAIKVSELNGKALFKIPFIGYIKLLLVDDLHMLLFGCPKNQECAFP